MIYLLVTCVKHPPEDNELDADDMAGDGTPQPIKRKVQQKRASKAKHISKTGQACQHRKLTSSESDGICMGKCMIEILQEDKVHTVNQKQKLVKQASLRFGLFEFGEDWETFLDRVAEACEATCEGLLIPSLCWRWMKPANSSLVPLCSIAGFASLKKKLTGTQPMVVLIMKPPQALASQKPVWTSFFFGKHMLF